MQDKTVDEVINDIDAVTEPVIGCPTIHSPNQRVEKDYEDKEQPHGIFVVPFADLHISREKARRYIPDIDTREYISIREAQTLIQTIHANLFIRTTFQI